MDSTWTLLFSGGAPSSGPRFGGEQKSNYRREKANRDRCEDAHLLSCISEQARKGENCHAAQGEDCALTSPKRLGENRKGNENHEPIYFVPREHLHAARHKRRRGRIGRGRDRPNGHQTCTLGHHARRPALRFQTKLLGRHGLHRARPTAVEKLNDESLLFLVCTLRYSESPRSTVWFSLSQNSREL